MKKLVAILLSLAMVLSLAACGSKTPASTEAPKPGESTAAPKAEWPKGNIDIIVPFKAGGAMDLSARLTADYLKKYLNVEVTVQNVEGGQNWVGYNQILGAKGDGYTLGFANYPGQVGGYLDPSKKENVKGVTYRDFTNIANIVHDPGIIVVREDSPYKTLEDLLKDAKSGKKLTISTGGGAGSDDDVLVRLINSKLGIDTLIPGGNENDAEAKTVLLNGEADARACNLSNYYKTYKQTGQADSVRVLALFDANKQDLMPDVPTIDELNIPILANFYVYPNLALKVGLQPGFIVDAKNKTDKVETDIKDNCQSVEISLPLGISYEISNFVIGARYNLGLSKINKGDGSQRNSVIMFSLGYKIPLGGR